MGLQPEVSFPLQEKVLLEEAPVYEKVSYNLQVVIYGTNRTNFDNCIWYSQVQKYINTFSYDMIYCLKNLLCCKKVVLRNVYTYNTLCSCLYSWPSFGSYIFYFFGHCTPPILLHFIFVWSIFLNFMNTQSNNQYYGEQNW